MKLLYHIFALMLITVLASQTACSSQPIAQDQSSRPTIPSAWLTQPPTPFITPSPEALIDRSATEPAAQAQEGAPSEIIIEEETAVAATLAPLGEDKESIPTPTLDDRITPTATKTPAATATNEATVIPRSVPTRALPQQLTLSAEPGIPAGLVTEARRLSETRPNDFRWVDYNSEVADITLTLGSGSPLATWLYAAAAPFATIPDAISLSDMQSIWVGTESEWGPIVLTDDVTFAFTQQWGNPGSTVRQVTKARLHEVLWDQRPAFTLLPFHELKPDLKVLRVDGQALIEPDTISEDYPLKVSVSVAGNDTAVAQFREVWNRPPTNYDPDRLSRVAMTGVTALVRATATQMETDGILSPSSDVGPVLRAADITHISNEVSFAPDCPEPNPIGGSTFCSQDDYFELLAEIGTDVVELTGNHVNDWGPENLTHSIELYEKAGMSYFGGGNNPPDAASPAFFEHNSNRIAFIGCNPVGPNYAWTAANRPGSRPCDADFYEQIAQLASEGYIIIATQQYYEFYHYQATPQQKLDFQSLIDAGATAVSGSQGHHVQGFEFYNDGFIHYGLGNLFFDQMDMLGTRQTFVDTYTIYDNKLLSVELWTGLIEDYSRPRLTTAAEREEALQAVFEASGW